MIEIKKPNITIENGIAILECKILINDMEKNLFYEIDQEYKEYLCFERSDPFVIATLHYAMKHNHDIYSELPITASLHHNLVTYLIPILAKNSDMLNEINLNIPIAEDALPTKGEVGTGMSCGIDSFHTLKNYLNPKDKSMKLTYLCLNNVGSFNTYKKKYNGVGEDKAREELITRATKVAKEVNLPLIITNSNVHKIFSDNYYRVHSFANMFSVFMLQKLFKIYYYSSTGYEFSDFTVKDDYYLDSGEYELLIFYVLSTENLKIHSEGMASNRLEKTIDIADFPLAHNNLHVCCSKEYNCTKCTKCKRTLLALDAIGKLNSFKNVFDIKYYKEHKDEYYEWLEKEGTKEDKMNIPTEKLLLQKRGKTEYQNIESFNKYNIIIPENTIEHILIKKKNKVILNKNQPKKIKSNLYAKLMMIYELLENEEKKIRLKRFFIKNYGHNFRSFCIRIKDAIFNTKTSYSKKRIIYELLYSTDYNEKIIKALKKSNFPKAKELNLDKSFSMEKTIAIFNKCLNNSKFNDLATCKKKRLKKFVINNNTNIKVCAKGYYKNTEYNCSFYEIHKNNYTLVGKIKDYTFVISSKYISENSLYEDVNKIYYLIKTLEFKMKK